MDADMRGDLGAALIVVGVFVGVILAGLAGLGLIFLAVLILGAI